VHLAQATRAELLLLYVVPPPTPIFEVESSLKSEAEIALGLVLAKLAKLGVRSKGYALTGTGSIDGLILRAAKLGRVDLIIMEGPRRSWLRRLFKGNLAARVMSRAHCPVLVIPPNVVPRKSSFADLGYATKNENKLAS